MIDLKAHMRHKDGTYVAYKMGLQSREMLDHFVEMNLGLTERIDPDTYHVTVIYSKTPVPDAERYDGDSTAVAVPVGYEVFPTKDGGRCLVMRVAAPDIVQLNKVMTMLGATSDYDTYKPHVTICYNYTGADDVSTLPLPQFHLEFSGLEVKPLDTTFVPANK